MTDQSEAFAPKTGYFFGPLVDFLSLGGLTLFIIPITFIVPSPQAITGSVIFLLSTYVFNSPHFLSTYQIYYRGFRQKAFQSDLSRTFRMRYLFAGVIFPAALIGYMLYAALQKDIRLMAYTGNFVTFLVVWHYTKQGYGVLIIDSVYKKCFLANFEKRIFRFNALICWLFFWALANTIIAQGSYDKIIYHSIPIPKLLLGSLALLAAAGGLAALFVLSRRLVRREKLPLIGLVSYFITLYIWPFGFFHPIMVLIVPALHAIQYDTVVWRYEVNRQSAMINQRTPMRMRLLGFVVLATVLGVLGFYLFPMTFDAIVPYDKAIFGVALFAFIFHMFINLHHFVMDGVIWHHSNPETAAYLFRRNPNHKAQANSAA